MRRTGRKWAVVGLVTILPLIGLTTSSAMAAPAAQPTNVCTDVPYAPPSAEPNALGTYVTLPFLKAEGQHGELAITQGWVTSEDEEDVVGPGIHAAVDVEFLDHPNDGYGAIILAPADGCGYYSYQRIMVPYTDPQGVTKLIDVGAGLFLELILDNGMVFQIAHVDWVRPDIPFIAPKEVRVAGHKLPDWNPVGILTDTANLKPMGLRIHQGEPMASNGDTGIALGYYDNYQVINGKGVVLPRDRYANPNWESLSNLGGVSRAQAHIAMYGGRNADGSRRFTIDPFGVYGQITREADPYNIKPGYRFNTGPGNVFVTDGNGKLRYAG